MNGLMMFEGNQVEVFEFEGRVLFNPKDVAKCLDIADANSSIRNFNDKQVVKLKNSDMHNKHFRNLNNAGENFLTESGVYKLIFKSRKENAEKFQDWVTDEVLPTIRKTGGFVSENREEEFINNYFPSFSEDVKLAMVQDLRNQNKQLKETIQAQAPKVEYFEEVLSSEKLVTTTNIAKDLGMSARALNKALMDKGVLFKRGGNYNPYAKYEWLVPDYCDYKITPYGQSLQWTEKGRKFIIELLKGEE